MGRTLMSYLGFPVFAVLWTRLAARGGILPTRLPLAVCLALSFSGCPDAQEGGLVEAPARGFPDTYQALPPPCLLGENCQGIMTNGSVIGIAPHPDLGAWLMLGFTDGSMSSTECQIGDLSAITKGDNIYGDGFLARVDKDGNAIELEGLGDAGASSAGMLPLPDGSLILAGVFYPSLILGEQSWTFINYDANTFLARREPDGTWSWAQVWPFGGDRMVIYAMALQDSDLLLTGIYFGTPTLGGQVITPNQPVPGMMFVARVRLTDGSFVSFETLGTGLPSGLLVGEAGEVVLAGAASYQYGGQFLDTPLSYPQQFVARLDEGQTWLSLVNHQNAVSIGGFTPLGLTNGNIMMVYWWSTGSFYVTDGRMIFDGVGSLPMSDWQDGVVATLSLETGEWQTARTTAYQDSYGAFALDPDGQIWGKEIIVANSGGGQQATLSSGLCTYLENGATRACASQLEYYRLDQLAIAADGAIWFSTRGDAPTDPTIIRLDPHYEP